MTMRVSQLLEKFKLTSNLHVRWGSTKPKFKLKDEIEKSIIEETFKPRKHPGIIKNAPVQMPEWIIEAMRQNLEEIADRQMFVKESLVLANYLFSRRLPMEEHKISQKYYDIEAEMLGKLGNISEDEIEEKRKQIKGLVKIRLKQNVFAWKSLQFNKYRSLVYMNSRSPGEYSVLRTIFNEIHQRDPEFDPRTIFDFGGGLGTVLWAALEQWNNINEYLAVDISNDMNELSQNIMSHHPQKFKKIFYRQYLPVSNLKFDVVTSAYSLMELPNAKLRLEAISKLWRKTGKYLVIIEQGTNAGFHLVNEATEFVRHIMKKLDTDSKYFTFAPCPHDLPCPRHKEGRFPCNFICRYQSMPFFGTIKLKEELYSYVILKKGERVESDNWYRLVRPTISRSKHVRCRLCTPEGKLEEAIFTPAKHGKPLYRCVKASKWGDRLPIQSISEIEALDNAEEQKLDSPGNEEISSDDKTNVNDEEKDKILGSEAPFVHKEDGDKL